MDYDSSDVVTIEANLHDYRSLTEWEENIITY